MIDLHLHLDGSLSPALAASLGELQGIPLPRDLSAALCAPPDCQSLNQYLRCFDLPLTLLQSREALELAARSLGEELAAQGLVYAEVRFAPQLHTRRGLSQREAAEAVCQGLKAAGKTRGFSSQAILCCMRGGEPAANQETLKTAARLLGAGVCAVDLAGAEALYPTGLYTELFATAQAMGLPFTIHAGEAAGPESVWAAVKMGAARIGHGVRSLEDPALTGLLAERKIPLELCFTSNLQTKAVACPQTFPLREFLRKGLSATLNTDNLVVSGTSLQAEYTALSITPEERRVLLENAVQAAFLPEEEKKSLLGMVKKGLEGENP